jgi:hypothetical protein
MCLCIKGEEIPNPIMLGITFPALRTLRAIWKVIVHAIHLRITPDSRGGCKKRGLTKMSPPL